MQENEKKYVKSREKGQTKEEENTEKKHNFAKLNRLLTDRLEKESLRFDSTSLGKMLQFA